MGKRKDSELFLANLRIEEYNEKFEEKWDNFILNNSINGTFLQTRNFLNYHPHDRFVDNSLIIFKGDNTIVAVIPACSISNEKSETIFHSHKGSTFGGIIVGKTFNCIKNIEGIIKVFHEYIKEKDFNKVIIKVTSDIFCNCNMDLINYFLFKEGYRNYDELSFYIDFNNYKSEIISNFTASRRRDYKYSLKNDFIFSKIVSNEQIAEFHSILSNNLKKFEAKPVHSLEELLDLKNNRLNDVVEFYGVYYESKLIAGSMVFKFSNKVFHTQYLAADPEYLKLFPMNFLDTQLIMTAYEEGFRCFSFGISTEEDGKILNYNLAEFKEGFGTNHSINKTFYRNFKGNCYDCEE